MKVLEDRTGVFSAAESTYLTLVEHPFEHSRLYNPKNCLVKSCRIRG